MITYMHSFHSKDVRKALAAGVWRRTLYLLKWLLDYTFVDMSASSNVYNLCQKPEFSVSLIFSC